MTDPIDRIESPSSGELSSSPGARGPAPTGRRPHPLAWLGFVLLGAVPPLIGVGFLLLDRDPEPSAAYQEALRAHLELVAMYQLDAYQRPEARYVIDGLERVPADSPDYVPARDLLSRYRWERERAELVALAAPPPAPAVPAQPSPAEPTAVPVPVVEYGYTDADAEAAEQAEAEALLEAAEALMAEDPPAPGFEADSTGTSTRRGSGHLSASGTDGSVAFDAAPLRSPSMDELRAHVSRDPARAASTATAPARSGDETAFTVSEAGDATGAGRIHISRSAAPANEIKPEPAPRSRRVEADAGYRCYIATHGNPETRANPDFEVRLGSRPRIMLGGTELTNLRALREIAYARLDEAQVAPLAAVLGPLPEDVLVATQPVLEPGVHMTLLHSPSGALLIDPLDRYGECQGEEIEHTSDFQRGPRAGSGAARLEIPIDAQGWFQLRVAVPPPGGRAIEVVVVTPDGNYPALRFGLPEAPTPPAATERNPRIGIRVP